MGPFVGIIGPMLAKPANACLLPSYRPGQAVKLQAQGGQTVNYVDTMWISASALTTYFLRKAGPSLRFRV